MFLNFLFCICERPDGLCVCCPTPGLKCVESMQVKSPRDKQVLRNCALKTIVGYSIFDRLESDLQTYSSFLVQQTRLTLTDFTVYWDI